MSECCQIVNLEIDQRATFYQQVIYRYADGTPVDLTGYSAAMQIRRTVDDVDVLINLTSEALGGIVITPSTGLIEITIPTTLTAELDAPSKAVYDLFLWVTADAENTTEKILRGAVSIIPAVTETAP